MNAGSLAGPSSDEGGPVFFFTRGLQMVQVILKDNDRLDWALKQFRRKMIRSGLFKDMKKQRFYEKPSVAKRRKTAAAQRRRARARRRAAARKRREP